MNQKEQIKAEKKAVSEAIKSELRELCLVISSIKLSDCEIPLAKVVNAKMIEDIFNDQKEKFYNKEFSKLQTEYRNAAKALGRQAFEYQYEYLKNNPQAEIKNKAFTREETLRAYELVYNELYQEDVKAA